MTRVSRLFEPFEEEVPRERTLADADEETVVLEDQQTRTDILRNILPTLFQLWWYCPERMGQSTERLADGCRNSECISFLAIDPNFDFWVQGVHVPSFGFVLSRIYLTVLLEKWRVPLGNAGILDFYLRIFRVHVLDTNLKIHTLRLIGNACADTGTDLHDYIYTSC
jgi:hypothetical protein